ncbi:MAG: queuosine precursor transporter [Candidatus Doudnabacteria bacterium]
MSRKIIIALTLYLSSLFAANTLGLKLMPFLFGSHLSVAVFSFPIVFIMTDVIGEVYGKQMARSFVLAGFIATALFILYSVLSLWMPWSKDGVWARSAYNQIFGISLRFSIASLVAYAFGEYQDVFTFFLATDKWGHKYFWLRSNLSNIWSQFVDSVLFNAIAFIGIYSWPTLASITLTWWLYKVAIGICYTPLSYAGIWLLKEEDL